MSNCHIVGNRMSRLILYIQRLGIFLGFRILNFDILGAFKKNEYIGSSLLQTKDSINVQVWRQLLLLNSASKNDSNALNYT